MPSSLGSYSPNRVSIHQDVRVDDVLLKGKCLLTFRESVLSPSGSYSPNRVYTHQDVRVDDVLLRLVERYIFIDVSGECVVITFRVLHSK